MKLRIFYAFLTDDNEQLEYDNAYLDTVVSDTFWRDYAVEFKECQGIVNSRIPRMHFNNKLFKPIVQHWIKMN